MRGLLATWFYSMHFEDLTGYITEQNEDEFYGNVDISSNDRKKDTTEVYSK